MAAQVGIPLIPAGTTVSIKYSPEACGHEWLVLTELRTDVQGRSQTFLTSVGSWLARPAAFGCVVIYAVLWLIFDRDSFNFHGAIALITLCMTLFIQRSEHRDTQAIQAKLDELLRSQGDARTSLTGLDEQEPEQIEAHRARAKAHDR